MVLVLGVHHQHDAGACIVRDGQIIAAVNEERLTRIKHHWSFPIRSIKEVLRITNLKPEQFDAIAIPWLNPSRKIFKYAFSTLGIKGIQAIQEESQKKLTEINPIKRILSFPLRSMKIGRVFAKNLKNLGFNQKIYWVDHHLAHAASTYFSSGFDKAVVITCDGAGEGLSGTVNIAEDGKIRNIAKTDENNSPGWLYSAVSCYLGFRFLDGEYKTTSFASFGKQNKAYDRTLGLIDTDESGLMFRTSKRFLPLSMPDDASDDRLSGKNGELQDARIDMTEIDKVFAGLKKEDAAAAMQKRFEDVFVKHVKSALRHSALDKKFVCLSGGVTLNVKINMKVRLADEVDDLFIFPAASDGGVFAGAALYVCNQLMDGEMGSRRLQHMYYGTEFTNMEIEDELKKYHDIEYEKTDPVKTAVDRILDGKILGWFQGKMEYGPRALGNRSVIGDPRDKEIVKRVNNILKQRDWFMPYAPSMIEEVKDEYLEDPETAPFMIMAFWSTKKLQRDAPAAVHIDKSVRPQTVSKETNPKYWKLIKLFGDRTGVPVLLNTSFNKHGQPIVWSPENAVWHLMNEHVDELIIGDYWVTRKSAK